MRKMRRRIGLMSLETVAGRMGKVLRKQAV
jgi:hypothetical protein